MGFQLPTSTSTGFSHRISKPPTRYEGLVHPGLANGPICEAPQVALEAIRNKALEQQEAGTIRRFTTCLGHVYRLRSYQISGDILLGCLETTEVSI